jgi:trigger factor
MQVTVEDINTVKKVIQIEIDQDKVSNEIDQAYRDLKKQAKVKGFRPGKAPRSVLERLYGKDVHADVSSKLIQESLVDAIRDADLKILGNPRIDPPDLEDKAPYRFEATIEVSPELEDIDFNGLELKKTLYAVSDEEIQTQFGMLQKNLAYHKDIEEDRPVQQDDTVLIDYEGFIDGNPFEETQKTENFTLKIGDSQISKEFDDQLVGMKPTDGKNFSVAFPEDYFNPKLAGREIEFQVTLKGIREQVIPPIDDDLAKKLGKYESLEDLKKAIVENLEEGYAKRTEQELNEQIFTALISRKDFEVPEILVESELEAIIEEAERSLAYHNKSMEEAGLTKEGLKEKYSDTAEKQVKRYMLLNKLIEQENIAVSGEDLEKGYADMAKAFGQPVEEIKHYYQQNRDKLDFFRHTLLEKQAINLIMDRSRITEVAPEPAQADEASS